MATKLYRRLTGTGANRVQKYANMFIEAIRDGNMQEIRRLLRGKIKMAVPLIWPDHGREEIYPVHVACAIGSLDVVKLMFRNGATLENKTESGYTPLHFSCCYNNTHPEVTEHLLDMGARPNAKDKVGGQTPFHKACISNNYGAAKRLMAYTKPTVQDNTGKTAKDIAIENDCDQIVSLFEVYDEESRREEQLRHLPYRLEELERKTEAFIRNRSIQSLLDQRHRHSSGFCSTDGLHIAHNFGTTGDLISLHTDGGKMDSGFAVNQRLLDSSITSLNSTYSRLPHVPEQGFRNTYHGGDTGCIPVANSNNKRQSFSPVRTHFPESIEEEPQTPGS